MSDPTEKEYVAAIQTLIGRALEWTAAHPTSQVRIRWNFPKGVVVAGEFFQAVREGFVILNEPAVELCEFMQEAVPGATVLMIQCALELMRQPRE